MPTIPLPPDLPPRMRRLPRDPVGRPIPFFVASVDGVPDFRVTSAVKMVEAIRDQLCWVCGQRLNRQRNSTAPRGTFVAGPMCLINHTSAEPPSHYDCAEWSARACPFLVKPAKVRRVGHLPAEMAEPPGEMIERNPGVTALVSSMRWQAFNPKRELGVGGDGLLLKFSRIDNVTWMAEGRVARREEVLDSIDSGLPVLTEAAVEPGAPADLARLLRDAMKWVAPGPMDQWPNITGALGALR